MAAGAQRRMRLTASGMVALSVAVLATACGKTNKQPAGNNEGGDAGSTLEDDVSGAGAGVGGSGGGGAVAGAETSGGGGADAGASGSGGEGGVPEVTRPITVRVVDRVPQPLSGIRVLVNGIVSVSDDNGLVHAQAPLGAYDIAVDDDADGADYATGVSVFQGITIDEPTLRLDRDYADQFPPRSSASGKLIGNYPNGAVANVSFVSSSGWLETAHVAQPVGSDYTLSAEWTVDGASAPGDVFALLWTLGADQRADAFWFGSAPVTWGPKVALQQDITVAPTSMHGVTFKIAIPAGTALRKGLGLGSVTILNDPPLDTELVVPRALATASGPLNPHLGLVIEPLNRDFESPYTWGSIEVTDDASEIVVDEPSLLQLLAPPPNAKKVGRTTTFKVSDIPNTCKVFTLVVGGYSPRIYTAQNELVPPDLSALDQHWSGNSPSTFWAAAIGPCSSIDELVAPTSDPAAQTRRFDGGRSHFRSR